MSRNRKVRGQRGGATKEEQKQTIARVEQATSPQDKTLINKIKEIMGNPKTPIDINDVKKIVDENKQHINSVSGDLRRTPLEVIFLLHKGSSTWSFFKKLRRQCTGKGLDDSDTFNLMQRAGMIIDFVLPHAWEKTVKSALQRLEEFIECINHYTLYAKFYLLFSMALKTAGFKNFNFWYYAFQKHCLRNNSYFFSWVNTPLYDGSFLLSRLFNGVGTEYRCRIQISKNSNIEDFTTNIEDFRTLALFLKKYLSPDHKNACKEYSTMCKGLETNFNPILDAIDPIKQV